MLQIPYEGTIKKSVSIDQKKNGLVIYVIEDGNQQFAVKQIRKNERNMNEFHIAEQLLYPKFDHQNIVRIYDASIWNELIFLKMELGQDIRNLINQNLGTKEILKLMLDVALGLNELKSHNIFHRDIKPHNIIYANGNYKLIDFGISKHLSDIRKSAQTKCGTKPYMAPQVYLSNQRKYTAKCDIWSLGATIYELVYGCYVFGDQDQRTFFEKFGKSPYQIVYLKKYSEINAYLRYMLVYDETNRWSVEDLLQNLQDQSTKFTWSPDISQQCTSAVMDQQYLNNLIIIDESFNSELQAALYKTKISFLKRLIEIQSYSGNLNQVESLKLAMQDHIIRWVKFQSALSPQVQNKIKNIDFVQVVKDYNKKIYNDLEQYLN